MIQIDDKIAIDEGELDFVTSRSSGPGGQNVNKLETRVTLRFDVEASPALGEAERARIRERLATRINKAGVLRVSSQRHRSQAQNRDAACERFADLLRQALSDDPPRRPTRMPRAAKKRRLENKRRRGEIKRQRSRVKPPRE